MSDYLYPMTVRLASFADSSAIARIYNQGIEERIATFETDFRTAAQMEVQLRERMPAHPTVVVERGDDVIAWAGVGPYSARPCYAGVAEFSVYVDAAARGIGAGRLALERLFAECEARGIWKLVSRIFPENIASRRLCQSVGFREVGVYSRHARLDGQWRDTVIVEKLLGEAARDLP